MYQDLIKKPESWQQTLEKSKNALSFDEKIKLVAKLGNQFNYDYNYKRTEEGSAENEGIVSTETMLRNLSTSDAGGVCRDVSLSQSQMLKSLGINQSYSVAHSSNRGGHATLIVVDPNDKNRIIKLNYGDVQTDDGKKEELHLIRITHYQTLVCATVFMTMKENLLQVYLLNLEAFLKK